MNLGDDDFTLFALPPQFALDRELLDERWRRLQAEVHPDRFVADGQAAQRRAMQWAARVNEAYRRLRDPLSRGAYLCELRGAAVAAESNTAMPAAFLMEQMDWREALDDLNDAAGIESLEAKVRHRERGLFDELAMLLDRDGDAVAAAQRVRALMFVARFRQDIERRQDATPQPD